MAPMKVRKVVIPAAGLGTRFLPATKAVPKEMLPIVDTPTLQYIVEEAVAGGVSDVILITGRGKHCIEDHFDVSFELERTLADRGKTKDVEQLSRISNLARIISIRQRQALGLGHAVLCARDAVGNEPFGVMLGDDMIDSAVPGIQQLCKVYERSQKGVIALMQVPYTETHLYGIAAVEPIDSRTFKVTDIVEKPRSNPPSNWAVIGRYVLPPSIFGHLEAQPAGVGGEIQLTDGLARLKESEGLLGYAFEGHRYDAGDKLGYLKANIAYALKRSDLQSPLLNYLRELVRT